VPTRTPVSQLTVSEKLYEHYNYVRPIMTNKNITVATGETVIMFLLAIIGLT
jgi:hypothetical protein